MQSISLNSGQGPAWARLASRVMPSCICTAWPTPPRGAAGVLVAPLPTGVGLWPKAMVAVCDHVPPAWA